ncbi:MAG: valine--tRNA ligase, partial [Bacteroidales bacterium]|nr:valine--tRNA ligase [Bacteroidales bacterium]
FVEKADGAAVSFIVGTVKCSVPLEGLVDTSAEKDKIQAELEHQRKFLAGVRAKLSNESFVSRAPQAVVDTERKKEADALSRIEALEASLKSLN